MMILNSIPPGGEKDRDLQQTSTDDRGVDLNRVVRVKPTQQVQINRQKGKQQMKNLTKILALGLVLGASTSLLTAQDARPGPDDQRPPARERGPGGPGEPDGPRGPRARRPMSPLFAALDLNHDGVIDAREIATAGESLKKLDKNDDGKLTPDECRPPRPPRRGERGDFGGPRGDRPGRRPARPDGPDRERRPLPPPEEN
jgi:EF hand